MSFNVGDRVRISPDSNHYSEDEQYNPADMDGTVVTPTEYQLDLEYCLRVEWDNACFNSYRERDLVLAGKAKSKARKGVTRFWESLDERFH